MIASESPFVKVIVLNVLRSLRPEEFNQNSREVVHADLVPKFSRKVIHAGMKNSSGMIPSMEIPKTENVLSPSIQDNKTSKVNVEKVSKKKVEQKAPVRNIPIEPTYGRMIPLLNDPSVQMIDCRGANKPLIVNRMGRRQNTRIALSENEIRGILNKASEDSNIPLMDGVFQAAIGGFLIRAVYSELVGSKFIVTKRMPGRGS